MVIHKDSVFLSVRTGLLLAMLILIPEKGFTQPDKEKLVQRDPGSKDFEMVYEMGLEILGTGFNAGTVYAETWIRDLNTFINIHLLVTPRENVREALLKFFGFQGFDGNMIDGYLESPRMTSR